MTIPSVLAVQYMKEWANQPALMAML
jgi:hypothetical protein